MTNILFSYLAAAYIFSGLICLPVLLIDFNQRYSLSGWQRLLAVLASFVVAVFWPIWIFVEIIAQTGSNQEEPEDSDISMARVHG